MRLSVFALLAIAALAAAAPLAGRDSALPSGNLVQNPGAEASPGATTVTQIAPPAGWTTTSNFSAVAYEDIHGFPTKAFAASVRGGANFFAGGPNNALATATQTIDIAGAATDVDAGGVTATLKALLGGFSNHADAARVDLELLSATGGTLGSLRIGPVTPADRANQTKLLPRSAARPVPAGTRRLRVTITATRDRGPYNDGYADNVSVELTKKTVSPSPPAATKPTLTARCAKGKVTLTVRPAAGQRITSVTFLVGGKVQATDRRAPFTTTFSMRGKTKSLRVAARVVAGGKTVVLTRSVKRC